MSDVELIDYTEIMPRVGELAEELMSQAEPGMRLRLEELLDLVDTFHREGLGRLIEMIRAWRGEIFLESVARDEITGVLLDIYDLGVLDERDTEAEGAVNAALEELRPMIESHGGMIVLDSVVDGVVKVQMMGSCDGCPSSAVTLTGGLEEGLRRLWPNFRRLEVVDPEAEEAEAAAAGGGHGGHSHGAGSASGLPEPEPVLLQIGNKKKA